jgi:RNA polymerase sigma factor (sigma-70 family)
MLANVVIPLEPGGFLPGCDDLRIRDLCQSFSGIHSDRVVNSIHHKTQSERAKARRLADNRSTAISNSIRAVFVLRSCTEYTPSARASLVWLMKRQETARGIDSILQPFLNATDERESQRQLELLLTSSAEPLLRSIVRRKLQPTVAGGNDIQVVEDACSDAMVQLLARLREFKANPAEKPINNFRGYVAVLAYNTCNEHLRQKHPRRYSLRNKLRYLLTHNEAFALWEADDNELICGLARWNNRRSASEGTRRLRDIRAGGRAFETSASGGRVTPSLALTKMLQAVLVEVDGPVELDELVDAIAEWTGDTGKTVQAGFDDEDQGAVEQITDPGAGPDVEVGHRIYVQRLWSEIYQLPHRQRTALLLNLRDSKGGECIGLFPLAGISVRQIAQVLEIPPDRFAEIWNDLPLDDATIAQKLGITRQQVINLRKSARERLARRMQAFEAGT